MGIILSGLSGWRTADYSKHQQQLSVVSQQQIHTETCTHAYQGSSPLSYTAIEPHKLPLCLHAINKRRGEMLICDIQGQKRQHIKSKTFRLLSFFAFFSTLNCFRSSMTFMLSEDNLSKYKMHFLKSEFHLLMEKAIPTSTIKCTSHTQAW